MHNADDRKGARVIADDVLDIIDAEAVQKVRKSYKLRKSFGRTHQKVIIITTPVQGQHEQLDLRSMTDSPRMPLKNVAIIMARGKCRDASLSSSCKPPVSIDFALRQTLPTYRHMSARVGSNEAPDWRGEANEAREPL